MMSPEKPAGKFQEWLHEKNEWSLRTFGPGQRTEGVVKHIEKELAEIRKTPGDLMEWIDVVLLAFDGAFRAGFTPAQIHTAMKEKQRINVARKWSPPGAPDQPIEHDWSHA